MLSVTKKKYTTIPIIFVNKLKDFNIMVYNSSDSRHISISLNVHLSNIEQDIHSPVFVEILLRG